MTGPAGAPAELEEALAAAAAGAREVMREYGRGGPAAAKPDGSPVTAADLASDRAIAGALAGTGIPVRSEEGPAAGGTGGPLWVVDPLDGTADFVSRTGEFTVMVALVRGGRPVAGAIEWPAGGVAYAAHAGGGAFRRAGGRWHRISAGRASDPSACRVVCSRSHLTDRERAAVTRLGAPAPSPVGSSLKACRIAEGAADAYLTYTDRMCEWDTAAADCVLAEAGGRMTDTAGAPLRYGRADPRHRDGVVATNGPMHAAVMSAL